MVRRLRRAQWIPEFLAHVAENHVPIDFVTTHGYGDDTVENMFGTHEKIAVDDRVGRAVAKVRGEINKSALAEAAALLDGVERSGADAISRHDLCGRGTREHGA